MKTLFLPIGIYLLVVNLWGFIQMLIDKKKQSGITGA